MAVRIRSRYVVKPAEPTWQGILPLTELDQIGVITHTSVLYLYDRPTQEWLDPLTNKIVQTLKDSISRILVPFYPFAGRLSWVGEGRLQLECNAMGAELIEAESSKKISDFRNHFPSCTQTMFQDFLPHMDYCGKEIQELPLLAVQVTRFQCGGLSIGLELSHVILDGRSASHFIKEWARVARGQPLEVAPYLDRRVLLAETVKQPRKEIIDAELLKCLRRLEDKGSRVSPTFVVLTKDEIEKLRHAANTVARKGGRPYTRFEVIAAYVWRCMCKMRRFESEEMTTLTVVVDSRERMEPPLPPSYFGNAIIPVTTTSRVGELNSRPLSYACSKVREAIEQLTTAYVLETIQGLKNQQSLTNYQYVEDRGSMEGPGNGDNNVAITSWLNLVPDGANFGWGKEIYAGPPMGTACDGDSFIFPHMNNDGSLVVAMWLKVGEKIAVSQESWIMSKL